MEKNKKIDKSIIITYWALFILISIVFILSYVKYSSVLEGMRSTFFIELLSLPIFLLFVLLYKKSHREKITKEHNNFTRKMRHIGAIIFFTAVTSIFITVISNHSAYLSDYQGTSINKIEPIKQIFRDLAIVVWPLLLLLFAINFTTQKNENSRYKNVKDFLFNLVFFAILIPLCGLFGTIISDIYLFFFLLLKK